MKKNLILITRATAVFFLVAFVMVGVVNAQSTEGEDTSSSDVPQQEVNQPEAPAEEPATVEEEEVEEEAPAEEVAEETAEEKVAEETAEEIVETPTDDEGEDAQDEAEEPIDIQEDPVQEAKSIEASVESGDEGDASDDVGAIGFCHFNQGNGGNGVYHDSLVQWYANNDNSKDGHEKHNYDFLVYPGGGIDSDEDCDSNSGNGPQPEETFTVNLTKIICESESSLPNWGDAEPQELIIDENTAETFVADSKGACEFAEGWEFQYAYENDGNGNNTLGNGDAPDGDTYGPAGSPWTTFGPTNSSGLISEIFALSISKIWFREVLQNGYISFSDAQWNSTDENADVSAEFYCDGDVRNYDNYDFITGLEDGGKYYCVAFNVEEEEVIENPVTINAHKIVCENESDLPNWGNGGSNINSQTAIDWVEEHDSCDFVEGWKFQYSTEETDNPLGDYYGATSSPWTTFDPTDANGLTTVDIDTDASRIYMREVLQEGYIPFTNMYPENGYNNSDDYSAEFYCHNDVYNYDNFEYVNGVQRNNEYYCVAFNVLEEDANKKYDILVATGNKGGICEYADFDVSESKTYEAFPDEGYEFDRWEGVVWNYNETENPMTLTPDDYEQWDIENGGEFSSAIEVSCYFEEKTNNEVDPVVVDLWGNENDDRYIYLTEGESITLQWTSENALKCNAYPSSFSEGFDNLGITSTSSASSNPVTLTPPLGHTQYEIECYNEYYETTPIDPNRFGNDFVTVIVEEDDDNGGGGGDNNPTIDDTPRSSGGSSGGRRRSSSPVGEVLGATTENSCGMYLFDYMKQGFENDKFEVAKLQIFLNIQGYSVPVTGFFGPLTDQAVRDFQSDLNIRILLPWSVYNLSDGRTPTGYVYKTTRYTINNIVCPGSEAFPMLP